MKEFRKKIGAILMTFVVLFSTMSFTVNQHYCGGELVASALFLKADSCGMEENISTKEGCNIADKNCCDTITKIYEGQNELETTSVSSLSFNKQLFVASFIYTYVNLFESLENNIIPFKGYTPPLLISDIQVIDQVFLI
ncbi:HYC_CC_PP family protein [Lutibacter sp.]